MSKREPSKCQRDWYVDHPPLFYEIKRKAVEMDALCDFICRQACIRQCSTLGSGAFLGATQQIFAGEAAGNVYAHGDDC